MFERHIFPNFAPPIMTELANFLKELSLHIEYLLHRHDCVVLPGIGALLVSTVPSRIADDLSIIAPATRSVCFNAALRRSDGLLAMSYSRRNRISYEDAQAHVDHIMAEIAETVDRGKKLCLGKIGSLRKNQGAESGVEFTPSDELQLETSYLTGVKLTGKSKSSSTDVTPDFELSEKRKFDTENNYYIAVNKTFARVAAIFCLVILAAVSVYFPATNYNSGYQTDQAAIVRPTKIIEQAKIPVKESTQLPEKEQVVEVSDTAKYYLIVASLRTEAEVQKYLSSKSDETLGVVSGKKISRVYAAKSDDRDSLLTIMRDPDFKSRYSGAWIWSE